MGPSGPACAIRTMISAPSSTVCVPWCRFWSVAVYPGYTALIRMPGNALAYWMVIVLTAALEVG